MALTTPATSKFDLSAMPHAAHSPGKNGASGEAHAPRPALPSLAASTSAVAAREPWKRLDGPRLPYPITQTTFEERAFLYWAASTFFKGEGEIVDAGCLAGSSTHALGLGLQENPRIAEKARRIHAYDLFRFEDYMRAAFSTIGEGNRAVGQSFLDLFERLTAEVAPCIHTHAGDFLKERWDGRPVEVLFVDLAKNWELEQHCATQFFPALIPGRSLLIQQDFFHVWCPWIHLRMDVIREYVEFLAYVPSGTAVFQVIRPIPADLASLDLRAHIPVEDQIAKVARCAAKFDGDGAAFIHLAKAVLLVHHDRLKEAQEVVTSVEAMPNLGKDVRSEAASIRSWITSKLSK